MLAKLKEDYEKSKEYSIKAHYWSLAVIFFRAQIQKQIQAAEFWQKSVLHKAFVMLLELRNAADPKKQRIDTYCATKDYKALKSCFNLFKNYCGIKFASRKVQKFAKNHFIQRIYSAFFAVVKQKLQKRSAYSAKVQSVKLMIQRTFYKQWHEALSKLQIIKYLKAKAERSLLKLCFSQLRKRQQLRAVARFYGYNHNKLILRNAWSIYRTEYQVLQDENKKDKEACLHYDTTLLLKSLYIFKKNYEKRKTNFKKIGTLQKKRFNHIKRVFFDVLCIKKQKRFYTQVLLQHLDERLYHLRMKNHFVRFIEGVSISKSEKKLYSEANQAYEYKIKVNAFMKLKKNCEDTQANLIEADLQHERHCKALLVKSFFYWKFSTREKQALISKALSLRDGINKRRKENCFKR